MAEPFWIAGTPEHGTADLIVTHPFDGHEVGRTTLATPEQVDRAVQAAADVAAEAAALPAAVRAAALDHVSRKLADRSEEVARLITAENGKPLIWARAEVSRAISTFRWAAEEARRFSGDLQRLDTDAAAAGRMAVVRRFPKGPVLGITPFNFPLNLVAHKVAPAIAVGAPIVVKPAPATPLTALLLGGILAETDLPDGMFSVLPISNDAAPALVADPRLPVVSFTGSGPVGAQIRRSVPDKHVTLELGGNAAAVVCTDWSSDADLDWAAQRIALFSNYQAGQSCIAVQRVIVPAALAGRFQEKLVAAVEALKVGDPFGDGVQVGPVISEAAAERIEQWVGEAVAAGGRLLTGGKRDGASVAPTVLADVPADAKVTCEEVFGPVLVLSSVADDASAFAAVNDSAYGLQAGVFTHNLQTAFRAHRDLQVGGVIVGDVPSFRADQMPYGGLKGSGVGREGLRSAMEDYTDVKVMVLTGLDL
ncbi:MAG: aldehyde dehydrogenase family protein [Hamadaea sp.]|uniref:aldehyde dehydrogenase family protein n=1 Tax=Hamadaea sp. TaxID=2024425 RepID=UPI0017D84765|nr:aldehyde dehydrogenase family protein [Hamadaea sp.]NUR49819.1 aldehyde dehydrogenase family protein [Hamadaea sp.]NUR70771.1 aldehyde dehydrogenase family protein [Hamadaea sp.]NUT23327.1 aldehyde dehydrogenase family protein [Hamadaea sp.]